MAHIKATMGARRKQPFLFKTRLAKRRAGG